MRWLLSLHKLQSVILKRHKEKFRWSFLRKEVCRTLFSVSRQSGTLAANMQVWKKWWRLKSKNNNSLEKTIKKLLKNDWKKSLFLKYRGRLENTTYHLDKRKKKTRTKKYILFLPMPWFSSGGIPLYWSQSQCWYSRSDSSAPPTRHIFSDAFRISTGARHSNLVTDPGGSMAHLLKEVNHFASVNIMLAFCRCRMPYTFESFSRKVFNYVYLCEVIKPSSPLVPENIRFWLSKDKTRQHLSDHLNSHKEPSVSA